jgi:phage gp37-like protein
MADLLIDSSIAQVEQAFLDTITLGLKRRLPPVADLDTLRQIPAMGVSNTPSRTNDDLVFVTAETNVFRWVQASALTDDGINVIKPVDVSGTGRWLRTTSTVRFGGMNLAQIQTGQLKVVVLHNGDFSEEVLKSRIFGQAPCVAIHFAGEEHVPLSQIPGALYDYRVKFEILSVSRNFRDGAEAAIGSPIADEAASDPGVMKIHGAVKKLLAGQDMGIDSLKYVEILSGRLELADQAERVFVMALDVEARGSLHNPDAPSELNPVAEIDVQRYESQAGQGGKLDLRNVITSGLNVPIGIGYAKTIATGVAVIGGVPVTATSQLHTFGTDVDTYRDLTPSGTWVFFEVPHGQEPSPPTVGNLRIGLTVTDQVGVAYDSFLCSVYISDGPPDQIVLP